MKRRAARQSALEGPQRTDPSPMHVRDAATDAASDAGCPLGSDTMHRSAAAAAPNCPLLAGQPRPAQTICLAWLHDRSHAAKQPVRRDPVAVGPMTRGSVGTTGLLTIDSVSTTRASSLKATTGRTSVRRGRHTLPSWAADGGCHTTRSDFESRPHRTAAVFAPNQPDWGHVQARRDRLR